MKKTVSTLVALVAFGCSATYAGTWEKDICSSGKGVDRCSSEREMIGEATNICKQRAKEAAEGFGMSIDEKDVSVKLTKWDHKKKKEFGKRSCTFDICFHCKVSTI
jgi:hypothetical protein